MRIGQDRPPETSDLEGRRQGTGATEKIQVGALTVDVASHSATLEGKPMHLTRKEFELLTVLVANPGRAFSREFLVQRIWGSDFEGFDRAVDTHVTRLRKKLGALGERIVTVWGVGYRFNSETEKDSF